MTQKEWAARGFVPKSLVPQEDLDRYDVRETDSVTGIVYVLVGKLGVDLFLPETHK